MPVKNLLSIDGGGIKGIIPACMLVELERQLGGKRTRDIFHFVAGTSTGAILTAGIAAGVPATDMLDLYLTRGREIFPAHRRTALIKLVMRLAFGHAYSTSRLQQVLSEELAKATEWNLDRHPDNPSPDLWTLNDADIDLLITAKRVSDGEPWYFVRDHPGRNRCRTGLLSLVDCITASAAAPFYFHPWRCLTSSICSPMRF